jgi:quercetin dioxygenase-like cupin family protein
MASIYEKKGQRNRTAAPIFLVLWTVLAAALAADIEMPMKGYEEVGTPGLAWQDARSIPSGARMLMVYGSPAQPGPYVFRVQFPAGYRLPPHRHPDRRAVTVLKGNYWSGAGEVFDQAKLMRFKPFDYYVTDAGVPHFAWAETDVVIEEMGLGPVAKPIEYVNRADDPRR